MTGITSRKTTTGQVISLVADGALNGVQTWQDPNGSFHLVLSGSGESPVKSSPDGVKVRRVGNSLEIEVQAKRGSNVTVHPGFNRLDLVLNGSIASTGEAGAFDIQASRPSFEPRAKAPLARSSRLTRNSRDSNKAKDVPRKRQITLDKMVNALSIEKSVTPPPPPPSATPILQVPAEVAKTNSGTIDTMASATPTSDGSQDEAAIGPTEPGVVPSSTFASPWWITFLLIGVLIGLVFWRRRDAGGWEDVDNGATTPVDSSFGDPEAFAAIVGDRREVERRAGARSGGRRNHDTKAMMRGTSQLVEPNERARQLQSPVTSSAPAELFGAYRVDQEVGKLVLRQPHRMDVLASRNVDDRRAMEAALLKSLWASDISENGRRKARRALEDYGFVARQSAALLLGKDACERVAAARMLGEVGLSSSLQFLLEALYDVDTAVRNQAVESIGALKLPAAIGALLDIARRYPDVSSAILSNALNACSIETLEFDDSTSGPPALLMSNGGEPFNSEITHLEPSPMFQRLPDSSEDELLVDTLAGLQSDNADTRATAAQTLALYRVERSVAALKQVASNDSEPAVRAVAVASLGAIDHESVFSAVLVALADEARDVRAAAARAVSRLSFDRADAYARVIEMSDEQELNEVACACIKTGMAAQALDRLSSDDRRQAYEAFSLLSLLAKANHYQPILDVIKTHADLASCKIAIQLLGFSGQPEIAVQLNQLAVRDGMPGPLRTLLVEVVEKIDKMQLA